MESIDWTQFPPTSAVTLRLLETPDSLDTRDLLKPLFRLCKESSPDFNFERAFDFVEFIVKVAWEGTPDIPRLPQIQPKYAFNSLIVMAQRISRYQMLNYK